MDTDQTNNEPIPMPPPPASTRDFSDTQASEDRPSSSASNGNFSDIHSSKQTRQQEPQQVGQQHERVHTIEIEYQRDKSSSPTNQTQILSDRMVAISMEVNNLLELVKNFNHPSSDCREFRYIEEMLTRCMLNLDQIECSQMNDLRQKRKSICRWIEQVSKILNRKVELNKELAELSHQLGSHP